MDDVNSLLYAKLILIKKDLFGYFALPYRPKPWINCFDAQKRMLENHQKSSYATRWRHIDFLIDKCVLLQRFLFKLPNFPS